LCKGCCDCISKGGVREEGVAGHLFTPRNYAALYSFGGTERADLWWRGADYRLIVFWLSRTEKRGEGGDERGGREGRDGKEERGGGRGVGGIGGLGEGKWEVWVGKNGRERKRGTGAGGGGGDAFDPISLSGRCRFCVGTAAPRACASDACLGMTPL